jgi:hypothetical protein
VQGFRVVALDDLGGGTGPHEGETEVPAAKLDVVGVECGDEVVRQLDGRRSRLQAAPEIFRREVR